VKTKFSTLKVCANQPYALTLFHSPLSTHRTRAAPGMCGAQCKT